MQLVWQMIRLRQINDGNTDRLVQKLSIMPAKCHLKWPRCHRSAAFQNKYFPFAFYETQHVTMAWHSHNSNKLHNFIARLIFFYYNKKMFIFHFPSSAHTLCVYISQWPNIECVNYDWIYCIDPITTGDSLDFLKIVVFFRHFLLILTFACLTFHFDKYSEPVVRLYEVRVANSVY